MSRLISRRTLLRGAPAIAFASLSTPSRAADLKENFLHTGEWIAYRVQRFLGSNALAPEYSESEMSPLFRTNGNTLPSSADYQTLAAGNFVDWKLSVQGLFNTPGAYSLAELRAMPSRTQITMHNCVEGWSAIGKWKGVPLSHLLNTAGLRPEARFIVFHCADDFNGTAYYESIDLNDAFHPQTILAYDMNDAPLAIGHGAPVRARIERQLGYKHAKFVMGIEAVDSLGPIGQGKGGFWEDVVDYDWYAGI